MPPALAGGLVREFHFTKYPDINAPQNSQTPSFISNLLLPPALAGRIVREFHFTKYPDINAPQNSSTPSFISNLHLPPALAGGKKSYSLTLINSCFEKS